MKISNSELIKAHKVIVKQFYGNATEFNKANPPVKGVESWLIQYSKPVNETTKGSI